MGSLGVYEYKYYYLKRIELSSCIVKDEEATPAGISSCPEFSGTFQDQKDQVDPSLREGRVASLPSRKKTEIPRGRMKFSRKGKFQLKICPQPPRLTSEAVSRFMNRKDRKIRKMVSFCRDEIRGVFRGSKWPILAFLSILAGTCYPTAYRVQNTAHYRCKKRGLGS
jgi:hypothetical protein